MKLSFNLKFLFLCLALSLINLVALSSGASLKYVWGDALEDPLALGPGGEPYPWDLAAKIASRQRLPRSMLSGTMTSSKSPIQPGNLLSPWETREVLLQAFSTTKGFTGNFLGSRSGREARSSSDHSPDVPSSNSSLSDVEENVKPQGQGSAEEDHQGCVPSRLCSSTYNTTAPLYGVSLTSGQPVTIVQKFPDLLQQIIFQKCSSTECEVLRGDCVQTYLPYLFLVIPLGPVTLTGQDYVLVESGCVCQPKYAKKNDQPPPLPFIKPII